MTEGETLQNPCRPPALARKWGRQGLFWGHRPMGGHHVRIVVIGVQIPVVPLDRLFLL